MKGYSSPGGGRGRHYGEMKPSEYPGRRAHGVIDRGLETDANTPAVPKGEPMIKPEKSKPHSGAA